ncbi:unnamed protein product, partial [Brachionus calyciflorus]
MDQINFYILVSCYLCFLEQFNISKTNFEANYSDYIPLCEDQSHLKNFPSFKKCLEKEHQSLKNRSFINKLADELEFKAKETPNNNNNNNVDNFEFIENKLNLNPNNKTSLKNGSPKNEYSDTTTVFLTLVYTLTIVLSIVGNTLVLLVMCCGFRSSFLDISSYLMNLSVFNLLMSIFCIPFTFINALLGKWIFNTFMCPFTNFIQLLSVNGCIFTLTFLAINRFYAVAYPLKYNSSKNRYHNRKSLIIIWIVAILLASVQLFIYKCVPIKYYKNGENTPINSSVLIDDNNNTDTYYVCSEIWDSNVSTSAKYYLAYTIWIFLQTFLIPVIILTIMYSKIISILWNRNHNSNSYLQENLHNIQSEQLEYMKTKTNKTIRMLMVVIITFLLNWLPIHIFHLFISIVNHQNLNINLSKSWMSVIFFVCHWLSMSNSFINPIIYSFMNKRFKTDLKSLFNCMKFDGNVINSNYIRDLKQCDNHHKSNDNDSLYRLDFRNQKQNKQTSSLYRFTNNPYCNNKKCQNFRSSVPLFSPNLNNKINDDLLNTKTSGLNNKNNVQR